MSFSSYGRDDDATHGGSEFGRPQDSQPLFNNPETDVFIGGLDWAAGESEIKEFFRGCGEVSGIKIPKNEEGRPRGFCFVKFSNADGAKAALQLNGKEFLGRTLRISSAGDKSAMGAPNRKLFIANISNTVSKDTLNDFFAQYGKINSCRIVTDLEGRSKGFGFIEFETQEEAAKALKASGVELDGRTLVVNIATKKPGTREERGGRGDSYEGRERYDDRSSGYGRDDRSSGYGRDDRSSGYGRDDRQGGRDSYGGRNESYGSRREGGFGDRNRNY